MRTVIGFLSENWGNILVLAVVAGLAGAVLWSMRRRKKAGKSGCGCSCADCPSKGMCHPEK